MKTNSNPSISDELCWDFFVGGDFVLSIFRMEEQWYNLNNLIEEGGTHMTERTYLAIDLKSFYASVECMERGLDPMTTNLVVADASRTEKTICLAVSPSLKAYGIPGRARLFEVVQKVKEANLKRQRSAPGYRFTGASSSSVELANNPGLAIDYLIAPPRMAHYMEHSTRIYSVYLKHVAPDDIHVYSIDEVLIDATAYLKRENITAKDLAMRIILDVLRTTGITATAGIGPNLYLAKIAMDIYAKHVQPDENGVRIAELDEMKYRQLMWTHRPLTDFWRVGKGYEKKLESIGLYTMGDIARCSLGAPTDLYNEDTLYDLFGVNAELLIDHAWGWEPCTIADIKAYKPEASSVGSGQVLECPYDFVRTRLVVREMADQLALSLVESRLVTRQIVLTVGYDIENLTDKTRSKAYHGEVKVDQYGRKIPKHAHGTANLPRYTSSSVQLMDAVTELFERIADKNLLVRRLNLTAGNVLTESAAQKEEAVEQLDLFSLSPTSQEKRAEEEKKLVRERKRQEAMLAIKRKYGKNAILKGMNLQEGATAKDRNGKIGGHKA